MGKQTFTRKFTFAFLVVFVLTVGYFSLRGLKDFQLRAAMKLGDEQRVLALLKGFPCPVDRWNVDDLGLLAWAAEHGNVEMLRICFDKHANVNSWNRNQTALHCARTKEIVALLLDHGANVNAVTPNPLRVPIPTLNKVQSTMFVFTAPGWVGATPLHCAIVSREDNEVAAALVRAGADVNAKDWYGRTPLHLAAAWMRVEFVKMLLAAGAKPDIKDGAGATALHHASTAEIARLLLQRKWSLNVTDNFGRTPLHWAASKGAAEVVELLIENGADVNAKDVDGETPLKAARTSIFFLAPDGRNPAADVLVKHGAKE